MPRTKNQFADALAMLASMVRIEEGTADKRKKKAYQREI
jgi:hypothetical protein